MEVQTIAVSIIILAAMIYVGAQIWRKVKSSSPKGASCASDCGCGSSSSAKALKATVKN